MIRFTIRDLLWLTLVVALAVGWRRDNRALAHVDGWWEHHVYQYHIDNPNDVKRFIERERPPR